MLAGRLCIAKPIFLAFQCCIREKLRMDLIESRLDYACRHEFAAYRLAVVLSTMGGLKCVSVEAGEQCVMTSGRTRMQVWHADSWASQNLVKYST